MEPHTEHAILWLVQVLALAFAAVAVGSVFSQVSGVGSEPGPIAGLVVAIGGAWLLFWNVNRLVDERLAQDGD